MSALRFHYMPNGGENCIVWGCVARCRYKPMIAGYVLEDAPLCLKHRKAWEKQWISAWDSEMAKDLVLA